MKSKQIKKGEKTVTDFPKGTFCFTTFLITFLSATTLKKSSIALHYSRTLVADARRVIVSVSGSNERCEIKANEIHCDPTYHGVTDVSAI